MQRNIARVKNLIFAQAELPIYSLKELHPFDGFEPINTADFGDSSE